MAATCARGLSRRRFGRTLGLRELALIRTRTARRLLVSALLLGLGTSLVVTAALATTGKGAARGAQRTVSEGGTLVIGDTTFDYIDPALIQPAGASSNLSFAGWPAEDATCALLLRYEVSRVPSI